MPRWVQLRCICYPHLSGSPLPFLSIAAIVRGHSLRNEGYSFNDLAASDKAIESIELQIREISSSFQVFESGLMTSDPSLVSSVE